MLNTWIVLSELMYNIQGKMYILALMIKHSYCYENKVKCLKVNPWDQRGSLVAKTLILYVPGSHMGTFG